MKVITGTATVIPELYNGAKVAEFAESYYNARNNYTSANLGTMDLLTEKLLLVVAQQVVLWEQIIVYGKSLPKGIIGKW